MKLENCDILFSEGNKNNPLIFAANFERITLKNIVCNNEYSSVIDLFGDGAGKVEIDGGNVLRAFEKPFDFKPDFQTKSI